MKNVRNPRIHKCGDFYNNFPNNSLDHVAYYLEKREMENFGE
jgi:hypothetical protein